MNRFDACEVLGDGEPDSKIQYNCSSCDSDYIDGDTICCGEPVRLYANFGNNTPYEEWRLATLIIRRAKIEDELRRNDDEIENLQQGSRY